MTKEMMVKIFDDMGGATYDQNNAHFKPVQDNLHFLIKLILKDLPANARVLCVGVGTGADIIELAQAHETWNFVGLDPAKSMLDRCAEKLRELNLYKRCELFQGYLNDYKADEPFDAILCLFVMHFLKEINERAQMYRDMNALLKKGGHLVVAEISADFAAPEYPGQLKDWQALHGHAGSPPEKLDLMPQVLREQLGVIGPEETQQLMLQSGFQTPIPFFQSFLARGWHAVK